MATKARSRHAKQKASADDARTADKDSSKETNKKPTTKAPESPKKSLCHYKLFIGALSCFLLNFLHTSSLFENYRRFSHLSTLEREMSFRTEMGFYYYHYKVLVEAPSFPMGLTRLSHNNITEYPDHINNLKRFNVMPEVIMAGAFRTLRAVSDWLGISLIECYSIARDPLSPVQSCVGIGDPMIFYVNCAFLMAGLTGALVFLSGALLSGSNVGGVLSALAFFFNHSEATRVMWTPPLRETFAFPFFLLTNILITWMLRNPQRVFHHMLYLTLSVGVYLTCWQFSQYTVTVSLLTVYVLYALELLPGLPLILVTIGVSTGFLMGLILTFMNSMLMTSFLASSIISVVSLYVFLEKVFEWFLYPFNKALQLAYIGFTVFAFKTELMVWTAGGEEDNHVFNLLKSKFSDYADFHTKLYTCSEEFDFLHRDSIISLCSTFLLPTVLVVVTLVIKDLLSNLVTLLKDVMLKEEHFFPTLRRRIDVGVLYNIVLLVAYTVMAVLIMRLKLFMVPQMCILASLLALPKLWKNENIHMAVLFFSLFGMCFKGVLNIQNQRAIISEYQNPDLEELIDWTLQNTPSNAAFAGAMPTMANLMLSTNRPIVNHPHYESVEMRERTKQVYKVFSRSTPQDLYETFIAMRVQYVVLDRPWCFSSMSRPGCAMVELWDLEEPQKQKKELCPSLWKGHPAPFERVFQNRDYTVLQVPSKYVKLPHPKSLKS